VVGQVRAPLLAGWRLEIEVIGSIGETGQWLAKTTAGPASRSVFQE
jgi:hypothetical protein